MYEVIHEHSSTFVTPNEGHTEVAKPENWEMTDTSHTPAPNVPATVAPFRAWRGLQLIVARGPMPVTMNSYKAGAADFSNRE